MVVIPCSPRHGKHCSVAHHDLVQGYRDERYRQEMALEGQNYKNQEEARENLVDFKQWLIGSAKRLG